MWDTEEGTLHGEWQVHRPAGRNKAGITWELKEGFFSLIFIFNALDKTLAEFHYSYILRNRYQSLSPWRSFQYTQYC